MPPPDDPPPDDPPLDQLLPELLDQDEPPELLPPPSLLLFAMSSMALLKSLKLLAIPSLIESKVAPPVDVDSAEVQRWYGCEVCTMSTVSPYDRLDPTDANTEPRSDPSGSCWTCSPITWLQVFSTPKIKAYGTSGLGAGDLDRPA